MSLFDKITQGFSQVSDLFSKQNVDSNPDSNSASKTEKSNWFADLFTKAGTTTPGFNPNKQSLNQLSTNFLADASSADVETGAQQRISERDSQEQNKASLEKQYVKNVNAATVNLSGGTPDGYIQVSVTLPHNHPTPQQEARAILVGLKFKDSDIKSYNEHYKTDLVKDMSVGLGKNVNHNAGRRVYVPGEKKDVYVGYIAIDAKTHKDLKDFIAARRSGGELPEIENNHANANHKPSNIKLDPVMVTVLAGTGAGLAATMIETMPTQIATDIIPRAIETSTKVAPVVAEMAAPVAMIAAEVAPTVLIADHLAQNYKEAKDEFDRGQAAQTYDLARETAKATTLTMDDAEPLRLPIPNSKPKDIPFAEPKAKPKVTDLPNAPTDLVPVPKTKPETTTVQPDAPTVDIDAQPFIPDAPRNNQPQSPQQLPQQPNSPKNLDRVIPPIIAGTAASKAVADALKTENQSAALPPELDKIRASLKDPIAQKSFDQRYAQVQSDTQLDDTKKLAKFNGYLESAKQLGNGDLEQGLIKDLQEYTFRRGLNLPYGIENRITFATFGKQVREGFEKAGIKDAQAYIQGSAITQIVEKSFPSMKLLFRVTETQRADIIKELLTQNIQGISFLRRKVFDL